MRKLQLAVLALITLAQINPGIAASTSNVREGATKTEVTAQESKAKQETAKCMFRSDVIEDTVLANIIQKTKACPEQLRKIRGLYIWEGFYIDAKVATSLTRIFNVSQGLLPGEQTVELSGLWPVPKILRIEYVDQSINGPIGTVIHIEDARGTYRGRLLRSQKDTVLTLHGLEISYEKTPSGKDGLKLAYTGGKDSKVVKTTTGTDTLPRPTAGWGILDPLVQWLILPRLLESEVKMNSRGIVKETVMPYSFDEKELGYLVPGEEVIVAWKRVRNLDTGRIEVYLVKSPKDGTSGWVFTKTVDLR